MADEIQHVRVGGHRVRLTHLSKVMYPATGTTKRDVIEYYSAISAVMLPHCKDRAATRKRWPDGVGDHDTGSRAPFFQKDIGDGAPDWIVTRPVQHSDHINHYPLVNDEATLVWLAQIAALEIHVPQWRFDEHGTALHPDRLVLDLDPGPGVTLRECASVAFLVRDLLADIGLTSVPVTSGSSGIHVYASLDGSYSSDATSDVARELARSLEADHPDTITSSMRKTKRDGKVLIDWSQNRSSKTTVAPYSLRGRQRPFVSAPRTWRELASPHLKQLEFGEVLRRVSRRGDPMTAIAEPDEQRVHRQLELYRNKRDAGRTPEPVPDRKTHTRRDDSDEEGDSLQFVIQRHDAQRLHYDFRLEHEGVLVSWALPKGVPTDPKKNHLAVPTEDHPLEYRHFEGTIPRGEYGAGDVRIWDAGTYRLEKWREDEVIATLQGRPGGGLETPRRFALFRTSADAQKPQWMIHLMNTPEAERQEKAQGSSSTTEPTAASSSQQQLYEPMLATRGAQSELSTLDSSEWAFEMKWDGMRAVAHVNESLTLRSRSGRDITASYPEFDELKDRMESDDAVLDGEIIAISPHGTPDFQLLQERMNLTECSDIGTAQRRIPVAYVVFDILALNSIDCRSLPYLQRRELLDDIFGWEERRRTGMPLVSVPPAFAGNVEDALSTSRTVGLEGIVAKRIDSRYRSGVRSTDWLKFPFITTQEVVVIGWRMSTVDGKTLASLLLAVPEEGRLRYVGRVGTGFSDLSRRAALTILAPREIPRTSVEVPSTVGRDAHWVTPELWGEVTYASVTSAGRLRHPVWRGWRPDKP